MSFDHDAAGERGVARQELVDQLVDELFSAAEAFGPEPANAFLLEFHIGLLGILRIGSPRPAFFPNGQQRSAVVVSLSAVTKRAGRFTDDEPEYRRILLTLAEKLLASATSKIVTDFGMWESEKFQERTSA